MNGQQADREREDTENRARPEREIIVTYNAEQLGFDPETPGGLENVLGLFEHEPKPDSAFYIENMHYGVSLGAVIAMYTTDDPHTLVRALKAHYGPAISIVEEGGPMEAYAEPGERS